MPIQDETLKAMIRDYHGFEMSDAELALIRPELEATSARWKSYAVWTYPALCQGGS